MTEPSTLSGLERLVALPKAEVHVHLEGTFTPERLERWAREAGLPMPRPRASLLAFQGLADFLEFLDWACGLAGTADRLTQLARAFCERLAADGTGHADLILNPSHWSAWRGRLRQLLDALDAGFREAEQDGLPSVGLCVSLLRQQSAGQAVELVEQLASWRHPRVVALSVDGNEAAAGRTGPRFAEAFRRARAALPSTPTPWRRCGAPGCWSPSTPTTPACWGRACRGSTRSAVSRSAGTRRWSGRWRGPPSRPASRAPR